MQIKKRSVNILGHRTSISLEEEFWTALKDEAKREKISLNALIAKIDGQYAATVDTYNLSSALRIYILQQYKKRLA